MIGACGLVSAAGCAHLQGKWVSEGSDKCRRIPFTWQDVGEAVETRELLPPMVHACVDWRVELDWYGLNRLLMVWILQMASPIPYTQLSVPLDHPVPSPSAAPGSPVQQSTHRFHPSPPLQHGESVSTASRWRAGEQIEQAAVGEPSATCPPAAWRSNVGRVAYCRWLWMVELGVEVGGSEGSGASTSAFYPPSPLLYCCCGHKLAWLGPV